MPSTPEPAPAPRADLPAAPDHGLGVTLNGDGADFAVHAPHATAVDLCLLTMDDDGAVVEEAAGALYFDSASNSWASRNKTHITTIGGHKFYG